MKVNKFEHLEIIKADKEAKEKKLKPLFEKVKVIFPTLTDEELKTLFPVFQGIK